MKYQIKPKFTKAVAALFPNVDKVDYFYNNSEIYNKLIDLDVLDEFSQQIWEPPTYGANPPPIKIQLMLTLNSWADFYNEIDGYKPDYNDTESTKFGLAIEEEHDEDEDTYEQRVVVAQEQLIHYLLFDACVNSEARAQEMLNAFAGMLEEHLSL